ncbi:MAG: type II toxin-antitoxin system HicB family antitoxin [Nitrospira sp.]|nr:type II toxin-antitoxin system HicB family antitoxin [Nitrospira sp.]MDH4369941.1 type II toxin-antitoxin system HicB family antitoxin [Nitrospira sp.]MDH5497647.1 type II toxin-antitoxin system HicB family antitoxin [Nitrospira sp.]MDH5725466.1 type II toxin-antitoxin system HicB family antitoxin [Nitrospira sp.]
MFLPLLCYNFFYRQTYEVHMEYPIVLERDPEAGGYVVYCPTLKGCVSQGETEDEALDNIKDAIKTYLESIEDLKRLKKLRTVEVSV